MKIEDLPITVSAMTAERWVEWSAADDETRRQNVERDFGLNTRPENQWSY